MKLEDDKYCFVCGKDNPIGIKLDYKIEGRTFKAEWVPDKKLQGFSNIVHGGIVAALLDEAMVNLAFKIGLNAVSANLNINFRKPTIVGEKYILFGEIVEEHEKKVIAKAELKKEDGVLVAEGSGVLVKISK